MLAAPAVAEPTVINVLEPEAPPVPRLSVLVVPILETPVAIPTVCDVVALPNIIVPVCKVPPSVRFPVVCEVPKLIADMVVSKVTLLLAVKPATVASPST